MGLHVSQESGSPSKVSATLGPAKHQSYTLKYRMKTKTNNSA
jgi:hypothetical protein